MRDLNNPDLNFAYSCLLALLLSGVHLWNWRFKAGRRSRFFFFPSDAVVTLMSFSCLRRARWSLQWLNWQTHHLLLRRETVWKPSEITCSNRLQMLSRGGGGRMVEYRLFNYGRRTESSVCIKIVANMFIFAFQSFFKRMSRGTKVFQ